MATATQTITAPSRFEGIINYYRSPDHGNEDSFTPGTAAFHRRKHTPTAVNIEDIRGHEADFTLPKNGFQVIKHDMPNDEFADDEKIKAMYTEVEQVLKNISGASRAKIFSHIARRVTKEEVMQEINGKNLDDMAQFTKAPPSHYAHVDNAPQAANLILNQMLGEEEASRLSSTRWAIVNFWKPLNTVLKDPLAVCDFNTTDDDDLVNVYAVPKAGNYGNFNNNGGKDIQGMRFSILQAHANPQHRWYYTSKMQPDEALLIKIFDTNKSDKGKPQRTLHSAITHQEVENPPPRQSVEFRTMVFWEDQKLD